MTRYENMFKKIMERSNLFQYKLDDVEYLISNISQLINPSLKGEAVVTVWAAITDIPYHYCGVIAIGPFECMPNRLSEAILSEEIGTELPFLTIESDGDLFPQIITVNLKVFLLQTLRIHNNLRGSGRRQIH